MKTNWIVNPRYDGFFFIGSIIFTFLFLGVYKYLVHLYPNIDVWMLSIILYIVFAGLLDHPHIFQTFSRVWYDKKEFNKRKFLYTWGVLFFIIGGILILIFDVLKEFYVVYAFIGFIHIMLQNKGFIKAYKAVNKDFNKIDNLLDSYGYYFLFGATFFMYVKKRITYYNLELPFKSLIEATLTIVHILFFTLLIIFIARQTYLFYTGNLNLPKFLFIAATLGTSYLIHLDPTIPVLMIEVFQTAYHDVQYQGWMMHYQNNFFTEVKHVALYWFGGSLVYGLVASFLEYFAIMMGGVLDYVFMPFTMIILFHFYVDGLIWKFSKDKELKKLLSGSRIQQ